MALLTVQISNHKTFADISRFVDVDSFQVNDSAKHINVYFTIKYIDKNQRDVSSQFVNKNIPLSGNNLTKSIMRNDKMEPVPNPAYNPKDPNSTPYVMIPTYDYLVSLLRKNISTIDMLRFYVLSSDSDSFFD